MSSSTSLYVIHRISEVVCFPDFGLNAPTFNPIAQVNKRIYWEIQFSWICRLLPSITSNVEFWNDFFRFLISISKTKEIISKIALFTKADILDTKNLSAIFSLNFFNISKLNQSENETKNTDITIYQNKIL